MAQVYLARQPIYNHRTQVIAYDLIFSPGASGGEEHHWLLDRMSELGLPALVGGRFAVFPMSRHLMQRPEAFPFPSSKVIFWIADRFIEPDLRESCLEYAKKGYQISIDLESVERMDPEWLDQISIVRIDLKKHPLEGLRDRVYQLPAHGIKLLATHVETRQDYDGAMQAGCRFFHGGFFLRPEVVQGRRMPAGRLTVLRLLAQLQSPDTDLNELEEIISHDVSLSYRLLRHLNSAYFGLLRKVESIRHAVVYLGLKNLRVWASVILMTKIEGKPIELMKTALVRGRMCELLGNQTQTDEPEAFFTVGLLSTLDVLLDCPMEEVLEELPVSLEIQRALLKCEGQSGQVLQCVLDYEKGDWEGVEESSFDSQAIAEAYLESVAWGEETLGQLTA